MRVLIIGAGFGGLCLANGLSHQKGIQVHVFERHADPSKELAGYGLHLQAFPRRNNTGRKSVGVPRSPTKTCSTQGRREDLRQDEADVERRAVHRFEFRDILLKGLTADRDGTNANATVQWGKSFTHYEQLEDGRVRAHFADGSSAEGDILIGADGSKLKVREQRLPHLNREHLGIVIICGRYQLDETRTQDLPALMTDGSLNNIVPYGEGWLFVASFPSAEGESATDTPENYTLWAYVIPKSQTPKDAKALSPEQLRDIALEGIRDWAPPLVTVVRDADLTTVAPIVLQSMPILPEWESSNVTLLGDAIHNMTPMAGVGANIALRDAHILTDLLIEAKRGNLDLLDVVRAYEHKMRAYANDAIALSRQIAEGASSDGRLERWMFHVLLRVAHASPMVMKATIGKNAFGD
ncbi:hypothetical protein LTR10_018631 [Elasticomyces elasticus]|uniref:FAD-binding domain-containing protein n=1 Tax=Exophiala sideris TaxID=1016849 RepID=A0ABR0J1D6_9EURO|nr:hypothetical protein LTR10_018631 [Elasticomyces elasticus]KAK5023270.1 hypothetical protein LTS07_009493 [Exophiala sideris]KAK5028642.1 hypothetical protein LTR13_009094 [Exophiala sideris]KAK5053020.1 hypothetical protein LTR69_009590 [Exophiala sideris]KAK5178760.1 hypothetical protein LTR44_008875 [Eurotiomycetes sp. CCFEE 6388]